MSVVTVRVTTAAGVRRSYVVEHLPCLIGSAASCEIHLSDEGVQPEHARIESGPGGLLLRGALQVDGIAVVEVPLDRERVVMLAGSRLELQPAALPQPRGRALLQLLGVMVLLCIAATAVSHLTTVNILTGKRALGQLLGRLLGFLVGTGVLALLVRLLSRAPAFARTLRLVLSLWLLVQAYDAAAWLLAGQSDHLLWRALWALWALGLAAVGLERLLRLCFVQRSPRALRVGAAVCLIAGVALWLGGRALLRDELPPMARQAAFSPPLRSFSATSHPVDELLKEIDQTCLQVDKLRKEPR